MIRNEGLSPQESHYACLHVYYGSVKELKALFNTSKIYPLGKLIFQLGNFQRYEAGTQISV